MFNYNCLKINSNQWLGHLFTIPFFKPAIGICLNADFHLSTM